MFFQLREPYFGYFASCLSLFDICDIESVASFAYIEVSSAVTWKDTIISR